MRGPELRRLLDDALVHWAQAEDELRQLDAALGDGDLGITVAEGARQVREALAQLPEQALPSELLRAAGSRFATANPSTYAALVGGGILSAAKTLEGAGELDRERMIRLGRSVAQSIATHGKSDLGDKTVLDALAPSLDALEAGPPDPRDALGEMIRAAHQGVERTTSLRSRKGRAGWMQERSEGNPDPGATAYLRLLEAILRSWHT